MNKTAFTTEIPIVNKNFKDLNPVCAGFSQCEPSHISPSTVRPYFLIHFITSGKGTFTVGKQTISLEKNDMFIVHPHQKFYYKADEQDPWFYIWIGFEGELASTFLNIDILKLPEAFEIFNNIQTSIDMSTGKSEYLSAQLFLLLSLTLPLSNPKNNYARIIRHEIISNYMFDISVDSLSKYCSIHRNYANKLFKAEYGTTIHKFIVEYRMKKAKSFLEYGCSVESVAEMVGYSDYTTFSKAYKSYYGQSPSKVKNQTVTYTKVDRMQYVPDGINPFKQTD